MQRFQKLFFLAIVLFHLLYIWQQKYFLTADGPSHVANAKVLLDILSGNHTEFYSQYYDLNLKLSPNWFSHLLLLPLLKVFDPIIAEKILLSIYVLLFPLSFAFAVKQTAGKTNWLSLLVFPFIFHFLLYYGFYNYSLSIPLAFLFIGCWKYLREKNILLQMLILFPLSFLVYITHIFGWFIIGIVLGGIFLVEIISGIQKMSFKELAQDTSKKWGVVIATGLITVGASLLFMQQNSAEMQYWPEELWRLREVFFRLEMLVLWGTDREFLLIQLFVYLLAFLTITLLAYRIYRKEGLAVSDAWLFSALIFVVVYFTQPKILFLGGYWTGRMSWPAWLMLAAWLCSYKLPAVIERTAAGVVIILIMLLAWERFPFQQKTSDALTGYLSAVKHIPERSKILPISFSHHGLDPKGQPVNNDYRWQFQHAFDYCGAYKPIINYSNYEAATTWFPLTWKMGCSPFEKFRRGNGFEAQPPDTYLNYSDSTSCNLSIDYVVTWCMVFSDSSKEEWRTVDRQLKEGFVPVYESGSKRTVVWRKKKLLSEII